MKSFHFSFMLETVSVNVNYGNVKQDVCPVCPTLRKETMFVQFAAAFEN